MAEFPALPLWTDAYLGDTTHLTTIEHGAYLLLLMTAWRSKDGLLPNDDKLLTRYARLTAGQWKRIRPILEPFFTISSDGWRQGRLTDELVAVRRLSESQSKKAKGRWLKNKDSNNAAASSGESRSNASPNPTPNPTPDKKDLLKKGFDFDVDKFLSDVDRQCARAEAPGWDLHGLIITFNTYVKGKEIPKYPEKAFLQWVIRFTKGKSP